MTKRHGLLVPLILALACCAQPRQQDQTMQARAEDAEQAFAKSAHPGAASRPGTIARFDGVWLGGRSVLKTNGEPLPAPAERPSAIVLNSMGAGLSLHEIAAEINAQTGLRIVIDDRLPALSESAKTARPGHDDPRPSMPETMPLAWNGPLSGLLDGVAAYFGLEWDYRDGLIRIYADEVRTFTLAALPSHSTLKAGVSTSGNSQATGNTANSATPTSGSMLQDTANEVSIKLWDDMKEAIGALLPPGARVAMSPATGTVTVVAPPAAMRRIAAYIEQQNARITRQVTIAVKVLRVDLNDSYDLGLDLGVVFRQLAGRYAVSLAGPAPLQPAGNTPAASYLLQALQGASGNSQWASGSAVAATTHALVDALAGVGKVSLVTESSVTTLNGQIAPLSVAEQQSYVASTATTLSGAAGVAAQTQVTPATLVTGFNMQVLPRILDDGQILLQYGLSLSDLKALTPFTSNGTAVQLPDVNIRSFLQEAMLKSGDMLVLAGYQSASDSLADTGLPGLGPSILGGSTQAVRAKSIVVILIAPRVLARAGEQSG